MSSEGIGALVERLRASDEFNPRGPEYLPYMIPTGALRLDAATALVAQEAEIRKLGQYADELEEERDEAQAEIAALRTALAKLANEVAGLKATEFKVRNVIGDTNWSVLMLRETEARATLAKEPNDE